MTDSRRAERQRKLREDAANAQKAKDRAALLRLLEHDDLDAEQRDVIERVLKFSAFEQGGDDVTQG